MSIDFNANDIFEMAEQIERNGARFYRTVAESIADPDAKQMLLNLAEMEDIHEQTFADMRSSLRTEERTPTAHDPDDQSGEYLRNMASGEVFDIKSDPCAGLSGKETFGEIVEIAIGLEKDSITFYTGLRKLVPDEKGLARIDEIIGEEENHIDILSKWK